MDKMDLEFLELMKDYKVGITYYLKDITYKDMDKFVNRLYIFKKRKYIILRNVDIYAQLTGKPDWFYLNFTILKKSYIQDYLSKNDVKQLKLDL